MRFLKGEKKGEWAPLIIYGRFHPNKGRRSGTVGLLAAFYPTREAGA